MNCFGRWSPETWLARALGLLLLGWLLAPSAARAECGDYVHFKASPNRTHAPLKTADTAPVDPLPCPCHGPMCSRGNPPPLAPVVNISVIGEQWGLSNVHSNLPEEKSTLLSFLPNAVFLDPAGTSIFHPPRLPG